MLRQSRLNWVWRGALPTAARLTATRALSSTATASTATANALRDFGVAYHHARAPEEPRHVTVSKAWAQDGKLVAQWADNLLSGPRASRLSAVWLRDSCQCPACFDGVTLQRKIDTSAIPTDLTVQDAMVVTQPSGPARVVVKWSDGHESAFTSAWLRRHCYSDWAREERRESSNAREAVERFVWSSKIVDNLPSVPYDEFMSGPAGVGKLLKVMHTFGMGLVVGAPATAEKTEELIQRVSFIRETLFGKFWVFEANGAHADTAYTAEALDLHTDSSYLADPPGVQVLSCLFNPGTGGYTVLADGMHIANVLRSAYPEEHKWLTTTKIPFRYLDPKTGDSFYQHQTPLTYSDSGDFVQIRFNNNDRIQMPGTNDEEIALTHRSLTALIKTLRTPEHRAEFRLKPGVVLFMDNWRVLHGRTSFTGPRRMCGAYLSREDVLSQTRRLA